MKIREIVNPKSQDVISVRVEDTIQTVAQILAINNIGAVPVRDSDGRLAGVLSERDLARSLSRPDGRLRDLTSRDLMTINVITCSPEDDLHDAMHKLSAHHIRHLPVIDNGELVGMISSRDVLEATIGEVTMERNVLRDIAIVKS